jgi:hypothetical protein
VVGLPYSKRNRIGKVGYYTVSNIEVEYITSPGGVEMIRIKAIYVDFLFYKDVGKVTFSVLNKGEEILFEYVDRHFDSVHSEEVKDYGDKIQFYRPSWQKGDCLKKTIEDCQMGRLDGEW